MSPLFTLKRVARREDGCFGVLLHHAPGTFELDGAPFAVTVERTFENSRVVIPSGVARCTRTTYWKGGYPTYEIHVPGHTRLLFHKGNMESQSLGCVLVAKSFGEIGMAHGAPVNGVIDSAGGFADLMRRSGNVDEFALLIVECNR